MKDFSRVEAIKVGGEFHAVEDEATGKPLPTVANLSEQCDNCGSAGAYTRQPTGTVFACDECGDGYPTRRVNEMLAIFA
jgi:hypothetical protein